MVRRLGRQAFIESGIASEELRERVITPRQGFVDIAIAGMVTTTVGFCKDFRILSIPTPSIFLE